MKTIKSTEFQKEIEKGLSAVLFSADWCPDCVVIKPFLPMLEADYPEFTFLFVDRDEGIDLCSELNIFGIPSFIAFNDGKEIERFVSKDRKSKEQIEDFLNKALEAK
ncbi:thioredoxin family protein [Bacillus sp. FJAT-45350]|uniref:thioredoxin family protein n=1 Tax=Bacillus sp. FJAT-45350 TaxID=2011014 RepID=UPI000BB7832F|nr:thioredoxin family protein [Bacillus sp. FJAT-45350]